MKSLSELSVIFVVILAFTVVTSVRSEYTWNGSEWVWSETSEAKEPEVQGSNYGYEGSGGGYGDDMDDNFDDEYNIEEGSGDDLVEDDFDQNTGSNYNSNSNYNNYNQGNSYNNNNRNTGGNNGGFQDYNNPYSSNVNKDFGARDGGPIVNFDYTPTTKAPFYNPEKSGGGEDIYMDPPPVPATTSTTTPAPRDPSIRPKNPSRPTSFFAQPGTLAAVIGGAVVGLLCAILCVMFVVYRMRKKDEGSYALDEPKRSPTVNAYAKHPSREFYA